MISILKRIRPAQTPHHYNLFTTFFQSTKTCISSGSQQKYADPPAVSKSMQSCRQLPTYRHGKNTALVIVDFFAFFSYIGTIILIGR